MKKFLLAGIVAFLGVPLANATIEVRIIAGAADTGWVSCATPATGCSFVGTLGNYSLTSNIASSSNSTNPILDLSYTARTSVANAGDLTFMAIADGYTIQGPVTTIGSNGNSTLGDTVAVKSYGGTNNSICPVPGTACTPATIMALLGSAGPATDFPNPPGYVISGGGGGLSTAHPYSLGIILTLTGVTTAGSASGDAQLNIVPEPASVTLLGGVMLAVAAAIRRKVGRV